MFVSQRQLEARRTSPSALSLSHPPKLINAKMSRVFHMPKENEERYGLAYVVYVGQQAFAQFTIDIEAIPSIVKSNVEINVTDANMVFKYAKMH